MKSEHLTQQPTYFLSGKELRIYFNETTEVRTNEDDTEQTVYIYEECIVKPNASRSEIIEAIIATLYTTGAELATINNQLSDPDEYATYQSFRSSAKQLADNWISQR